MNAFDPEAFAELLKKLIGQRAVKDFAAETGVSKYQVSRRLSCALITPPRKGTLKLFASHAQNGVTYAQLLNCCGYAPEEEMNLKQLSEDLKIATACLLSAINELHLSVRSSSDVPSIPCDLELVLGTDQEITWDICLLDQNLSIQAVEQVLDENYLALMYGRLSAYHRFSFLTGSRSAFLQCLDKKPKNLNANVSVILYCAETLDILEEGILSISRTKPLSQDSFLWIAKADNC